MAEERQHASDPGSPSTQRPVSDTPLLSAMSSPSVPYISKAPESFFLSRRSAIVPENDSRGPYGLNLLYSPPEPLIDLIFVHGLRGSSVKTWCQGSDLRLFWPKAWLPQEADLPGVRIHSFGYQADWKDTKKTSLDVHDFGRSLFWDMATSPYLRRDKDTRIILVGHSMGGLVMKKQIGYRLCFFLLLRSGGQIQQKLLNNILRASAVLSSRQYISDISRNSTSLQIISDEFRMFADKLQLWSFYETLQTKVSSYTSLLIVDRDSAVLGYKHEKIQLLNADHRGVCKFEGPSDPNYRAVRNSLAKAVEDIHRNITFQQAEETGNTIGNLDLYLDIDYFAEDDLNNVRVLQVEGSCGWIVKHPTFQNWRDSGNTIPLAYWLTGQPGSGKSVMSGHVFTHLQELGADVCYHFFQNGHKEKQSASGLVRQLAYQMASQHPAIRRRLLALQDRGVTFDKDDGRTLWRKLFVNEIFKPPLPNQQFWVIDGLDECHDLPEIFAMMCNIDSAYPIKLFFSSRKVQGLERQFLAFRDRLYSHVISPEDTRGDIRVYIERHCDSLAVDRDYLHYLIDAMVLKSDGSFLWRKLASDELEHAYSEDTMSEVLEEIPQGMSALYDRVLETMGKNSREIKLTRSILIWTACCFRNLSANELQAALKLDLNSNVPNIARTIEGLCGQLVRVERNGFVQLAHATVRDFLMGGCLDAAFNIKRSEAHERLAEVCILYLSGDELKPPKTRALISNLNNVQSLFADYAATSWSDHLVSASTQSDHLLKLVGRFLDTNVLSWIELIARRKGSLHHITRTSRNLQNFVDRRTKCLPPLGDSFASLSQWATDLLRIVVKFGRNILLYPSSIYFIVPPLCPNQSSIYKRFGSRRSLIALEGFENTLWGDCISYIEHRDTRAMSLSGGDNVFAIGLKSGHAKVYHSMTCQEKLSLLHGESIRVIKLDHAGQHIVTSGNTSLRMWDKNGHFLWAAAHKTPIISVTFSHDDQLLVACTRTSGILSWRTKDGTEVGISPFAAESPTQASRITNQAVLSCSISPDLSALALAYRGRSPQIWSLEKDVWIGACEKQAISVSQVLFNLDPSIELLAVTYQDGELALFDTWIQEEIATVSGDAYMMATTQDGRTLATGDILGTIKLWDFQTLQLLYCIKSPDYGIRALAFSGDGLRLFDIRESKCKVWEPTALVRKTVTDGSSISESASGNDAVTTVGSYGETIAITVMMVSQDSQCIFVGKDDGSVHAFDIKTGTLSYLYSHRQDVLPISISWNPETQRLATGDSSSTLLIWGLERQSGSWKAAYKILEHKWSSRMRHIALSPGASHILVLDSSPSLTFLEISNQSPAALPLRLQDLSESPISYATWRASSPEDAILMATTDQGDLILTVFKAERPSPFIKSSFKLLDCQGEILARAVRRLVLDKTRKYLLVDLEESRNGQEAPRVLLYGVWEPLKSQNEVQERNLRPMVCLHVSEVRSSLGFCSTKLVYLDKTLWVRSIDLEGLRNNPDKGESTASKALRYFFIPFELVGGNNGVDGWVTEGGDIVFPKEGDLGIIRNALTWII